ncbi:MAG: antA/AntB antirepressor family protein [Bacteroidales bacterium]
MKTISDYQLQDSSNDFISITESNGQQAVSAKELYQFLEVGKDFSNWIKGRINKYQFSENEDYEKIYFDSPNLANQNKCGGDRRSIEYILSLDMAKELCMVENNKKGREARKYFIEVEKRYRGGEKERAQTSPSLYNNAFVSVYVHEMEALLRLNFIAEKGFWVKNILSLILLHGGKRCFEEFGYIFSSQEKAEFVQKQLNHMCYNLQVPLKSLNMVCRFGLKQSGLLGKYNKVYNLNYLN